MLLVKVTLTIRLQGTDGIRGMVRLSSYPLVKGLSPVEAFLHRGVITEEFMELYTYSHVTDLMDREIMSNGDEIVIGWDPRDREGRFTRSAVRGIRKGGGKALIIGIMPTPAIPIYMLYREAKGAFMITASHNPMDQNGIKIFMKRYGLKPLYGDDLHLTSVIHKIDYEKIRDMKEKGGYEECRDDAVKVFREFLYDSRNTWIERKDLFKKIILIVDSANGAYSGIAGDIFRRIGVGEVIDVNSDPAQGVNHNSGVLDLEGISLITSDMVYSSNGRFANHNGVKRLFQIGKDNSRSIIEGKIRVSAAIFDADGDRFYRIDYNPLEERAIVLSGDVTTFHQAFYLISRYPERYKGSLYINTIESDLNASTTAAMLGFIPELTPVGDKWILLKGVISLLKGIVDLIAETVKEVKDKQDEIGMIRNRIEDISGSGQVDTSVIEEITKEIYRLGRDNRETITTITIENKIKEGLLRDGIIRYGIGGEESGHNITTGYLRLRDRSIIPLFAGNGLKGAINTYVATETLYADLNIRDYIEKVHHPFPVGFKKTFYIYYIDKSRLVRGSEIWSGLESVIRSSCIREFGEGIELREITYPEDRDILYIAIYDKDGDQGAAIFGRNSGTEDKVGINARGRVEEGDALISIAEEAVGYLALKMKDHDNPYARAEDIILKRLYLNKSCTYKELRRGIDDDISFDRLIKEVGIKEGFIRAVGDRYELTDMGKWYRFSDNKLHKARRRNPSKAY
ncbi:MAG: hypothetical protein HY999_05340 [Nitrospinae bacterium]|nr:hypothetical protein [Nitrospinota bacterium]